jgi:hypothetical protein
VVAARSPRSYEPLEVLGEHVDVDVLECLLNTTNMLHQLPKLRSRDEIAIATKRLLWCTLLLLSSSIACSGGIANWGPWDLLLHEVAMPY